MEDSVVLLQHAQHKLLCDPTIPLCEHSWKNLKQETNACTRVSIAARFPSECCKWVNKMQHLKIKWNMICHKTKWSGVWRDGSAVRSLTPQFHSQAHHGYRYRGLDGCRLELVDKMYTKGRGRLSSAGRLYVSLTKAKVIGEEGASIRKMVP